MTDNVTFNYTNATDMLKVINNCNDCLNKVVDKILIELDKAGGWWDGDSFELYKRLFTGQGGRKTILVSAADQASSLSSRLFRIAEKKTEWEKAGAKKI